MVTGHGDYDCVSIQDFVEHVVTVTYLCNSVSAVTVMVNHSSIVYNHPVAHAPPQYQAAPASTDPYYGGPPKY